MASAPVSRHTEERLAMRTALLTAAALTGLAAALAAPGRADTAAGFTPLFNGTDLAGWKTFLDPKAKDADPAKVWTIKNGEIHCLGNPLGYLLTAKEYGDYVLRVQWRWPAKPGNSGVFVHVTGPDKIWPKAVECQLLSGRAGDFWLVDGFKMKIDSAKDPNSDRHYARIGDKFVKKEGTTNRGRAQYEIVGKQVEKPVGEWNQYEITCKGNTINVVVNGEHVNTGTDAEMSKGHILLQSEGAPVVFRNVEIKSLK
jgi:Domain of Unknown Function (DUF1080)